MSLRFLYVRHTVLGMISPGSPGSVLKILRKEQGLTLRDLAALSGVSFAYIGEIERGKVPTDRVLHALEAALARNLIEATAR